ncbi:MAG TPA: DUF6502 family protein [Steroidobacteraceae bacterium]|nr:DUF6502 family protein [Steroidobacteraceae bacterium]
MEQSVKGNLLAAITHVLRPLCRIAIRNGIGFDDLSMALQSALVNGARAELASTGRKELSEEEVGLMAGMTALQVHGAQAAGSKANIALNYSLAASEVLAGWHSDVLYLGPYGLVLDIPVSPEESSRGSDSRSFENLVEKYAGPNVPASIVLDALLKSGAVQNLGNGIVRCVARTYIAERLSPENIQEFAEAVHNVVGTMAVNLKRTVRGTGLLQRTVFADYGLTEEDLAKFNGFIRKTGEKFIDEVDTWFSKHSNKERQGPIKTGIGLYHYVENDEDREDYLKLIHGDGVNRPV